MQIKEYEDISEKSFHAGYAHYFTKANITDLWWSSSYTPGMDKMEIQEEEKLSSTEVWSEL